MVLLLRGGRGKGGKVEGKGKEKGEERMEWGKSREVGAPEK